MSSGVPFAEFAWRFLPLLSDQEEMFPEAVESVTPSASRSLASNHTAMLEIVSGPDGETEDKSPINGLLSKIGATLL